MIGLERGDSLVTTLLGENLMEATARLLGIAVAGAIVLGLVFWLV